MQPGARVHDDRRYITGGPQYHAYLIKQDTGIYVCPWANHQHGTVVHPPRRQLLIHVLAALVVNTVTRINRSRSDGVVHVAMLTQRRRYHSLGLAAPLCALDNQD